MWKALPWDTIGPIATAVIFILAVVFGFILKWQKGTKAPIAPSNPPRDINDTHKKSLCFDHHKDISANATAIGMISDNLKAANLQNSKQHGKLFDKCEELGTKISETSADIITEIHKANGER